MKSKLTVSLIATVKNERGALDEWLDGIQRQIRAPDEIVIVDGGSTDGTWEALEAWRAPSRLNLIRAPGASIASGRNLALREATGDVIAISDCGTVAESCWLDRLVTPFADANVDIASGFFRPAGNAIWERGLAASTLPDVGEVNPETFLPSSRSVAVRANWPKHGFLYPEWLDYCEDLIWDLQLRNAGARFEFVPDAIVAFRVRPDWRSFWRQYHCYARGDGKAGLFGKRHAVRYVTYIVAVLVLGRRRRRELLLTAGFGAFYLRRPLKRLIQRDRLHDVPFGRTVATIAIVPLIVALGDVAKMTGFPRGVWWRWRRFNTLHPRKNWRRISPAGEMWNPAEPLVGPRRPED